MIYGPWASGGPGQVPLLPWLRAGPVCCTSTTNTRTINVHDDQSNQFFFIFFILSSNKINQLECNMGLLESNAYLSYMLFNVNSNINSMYN